MGWDIVAIGTHHTLPIQDPIETAKRLAPMLNGVISIGYIIEYIYNSETNTLSETEGKYPWQEITSLNTNPQGEPYRFILDREDARRLKSIIPSVDKLSYVGKYTKDLFLSQISDAPYHYYEIAAMGKSWFGLDILQENIDFHVKFPGRWPHFEDVFHEPYMDENKQILDDFRRYIYAQLLACGCDKAYYFPDQGYGDLLYDVINLPADEWVTYMKSRKYIKDDDDSNVILKMSDFISGKVVLDKDKYAICIIDDFSDFKE